MAATRPAVSSLSFEEFILAYPRMAGADPEGDAAAEGSEGATGAEGAGREGEQKPDELGDAGKAALKAERDARKVAERELKTLREERQAREDAEKDELTRATDKLTRAEQRAAEAEAKLARIEVGVKHGLDSELIDLLHGTPEEMDAQAEKLATRLAATADEKKVDEGATPPPAGSLDGGTRQPAQKPDAKQQAARVLASIGLKP